MQFPKRLLFLLCLVPFLNLAANAEQEKPLPSLLTPESQKVLDKLASLSVFPGPTWQYHAGDLPHGESPSADNAGWQAVSTPATLPAEAVWLRAAFEVPKTLNGYDLTGTQISFRVGIDDERSVTQIIYFNGRRVALGVDLRAHRALRGRPPGRQGAGGRKAAALR